MDDHYLSFFHYEFFIDFVYYNLDDFIYLEWDFKKHGDNIKMDRIPYTFLRWKKSDDNLTEPKLDQTFMSWMHNNYMVLSDISKQHGLRILKGVKIALKSMVLDFDESESPKKPDSKEIS